MAATLCVGSVMLINWLEGGGVLVEAGQPPYGVNFSWFCALPALWPHGLVLLASCL